VDFGFGNGFTVDESYLGDISTLTPNAQGVLGTMGGLDDTKIIQSGDFHLSADQLAEFSVTPPGGGAPIDIHSVTGATPIHIDSEHGYLEVGVASDGSGGYTVSYTFTLTSNYSEHSDNALHPGADGQYNGYPQGMAPAGVSNDWDESTPAAHTGDNFTFSVGALSEVLNVSILDDGLGAPGAMTATCDVAELPLHYELVLCLDVSTSMSYTPEYPSTGGTYAFHNNFSGWQDVFDPSRDGSGYETTRLYLLQKATIEMLEEYRSQVGDAEVSVSLLAFGGFVGVFHDPATPLTVDQAIAYICRLGAPYNLVYDPGTKDLSVVLDSGPTYWQNLFANTHYDGALGAGNHDVVLFDDSTGAWPPHPWIDPSYHMPDFNTGTTSVQDYLNAAFARAAEDDDTATRFYFISDGEHNHKDHNGVLVPFPDPSDPDGWYNYVNNTLAGQADFEMLAVGLYEMNSAGSLAGVAGGVGNVLLVPADNPTLLADLLEVPPFNGQIDLPVAADGVIDGRAFVESVELLDGSGNVVGGTLTGIVIDPLTGIPSALDGAIDRNETISIDLPYGKIVFRADGSYGFTPDPSTLDSIPPGENSFTFRVTFMDADGDTRTGNFTFVIEGKPVVPPPPDDYVAAARGVIYPLEGDSAPPTLTVDLLSVTLKPDGSIDTVQKADPESRPASVTFTFFDADGNPMADPGKGPFGTAPTYNPNDGTISFTQAPYGGQWGQVNEAVFCRITGSDGSSYLMQIVIREDGSFNSHDYGDVAYGEWHAGRLDYVGGGAGSVPVPSYDVVASDKSDVLTFDFVAVNSRIDTGAGDDTLTFTNVLGNGTTVLLNDGNNTLTIEGGGGGGIQSSSITAGDGDNVINIGRFMSRSSLTVGNGTNSIDISEDVGANSSITMGDGTKHLHISGDLNDSRIRAGDGKNTIGIDGKLELAGITAGDGENVVTVGDSVDRSDIIVGNGANSLDVGSMRESSITAGDGVNTIRSGGLTISSSITAGLGHDSTNTIDVSGVMNDKSYILVGNGENSITVGGMAGASITAGNGRNTINGDSIEDSRILAGDGTNRISIKGNAAKSDITAGDGENGVSIAGALGGSAITLGDGTNNVDVGKHVNASSITLGGGTNNIDIGDYVTASSITVGEGEGAISIGQWLSSSTINTGNGSYDVTVQGAMNGSSITVGAGDNSVDVSGNLIDSRIEALGGGSHIHIGGNMINQSSFVGHSQHSDAGGNGGTGDYLHLNGYLEDSTITAGAGNDRVVIDGKAAWESVIDMGAGNDLLMFTDGGVSFNYSTLDGGANDAIVQARADGDTAYLGDILGMNGTNSLFFHHNLAGYYDTIKGFETLLVDLADDSIHRLDDLLRGVSELNAEQAGNGPVGENGNNHVQSLVVTGSADNFLQQFTGANSQLSNPAQTGVRIDGMDGSYNHYVVNHNNEEFHIYILSVAG
jgi:hypothetical protein